MGILRDNWRFHTLTSPLLFSKDDEREREPGLYRPNKSKYFFIVKDIFLTSFKGFTFDRTHIALDGVDTELSPFLLLSAAPIRGKMDNGNRFQGENIPHPGLW